MTLSNKEVLALLRIGLEEEIDLDISDIANTEPMPVSASLAVAKRVEAAKGLARDGYKPLMRNRTGAIALPDRQTASDTFSPILTKRGLFLLAALPK